MSEDSELERELQFAAPSLESCDAWVRAQPAHAAFDFRFEGIILQKDEYRDTEDWAVWRAGYSLRIRRQPDKEVATLKALAGGGETVRSRRESSQPYASFLAGEGGPGSVAARVKLLTAGRETKLLFEVETKRSNFTVLRDDASLAVLSLDESRVLKDGVALQTMDRVEIEETAAGGLDALDAFVAAFVEACSLSRVTESKFEVGLAAAMLNPQSALDFGYSERNADGSVAEYAYAVLRGYFAAFLLHEPGARLDEDIEHVHDMRVAARRMRSAVTLFKDVQPPRFLRYREELKTIAGDLGHVRDLDVYLGWLEEKRAASSWDEATALGALVEALQRERAEAHAALLRTLDSDAYTSLVGEIGVALRAGEAQPLEGDPGVPSFALQKTSKLYRKLKRAARDLTADAEPARYHQARIIAKRFRYALEAFGPALPRSARRTISAVTAAQDLLGEHQDGIVAIERLQDAVARYPHLPPATYYHIGELAQQRRATMSDLRQHWPAVYREVRKSWRRMRKDIDIPDAGDEPASADEPAPPPSTRAIQRPFRLLQRFFARTNED